MPTANSRENLIKAPDCVIIFGALVYSAFLQYRLGIPLGSVFRHGRNKAPTSGLTGMKQQIENEIRSLFDFIRNRYPWAPAEAFSDALDRIAANVMGRTFGEVYASCMVKGRISHRLEAFMKSYRADV